MKEKGIKGTIGMEFGRKDFVEPGWPEEKGPSSYFQVCMVLAAELYDMFKDTTCGTAISWSTLYYLISI